MLRICGAISLFRKKPFAFEDCVARKWLYAVADLQCSNVGNALPVGWSKPAARSCVDFKSRLREGADTSFTGGISLGRSLLRCVTGI